MAEVPANASEESPVTDVMVREAEAGCAADPLHLMGSIQSHGWLVAVDRHDTIVAASDNIDALLGRSTREILGTPVSDALPGVIVEFASSSTDPALSRETAQRVAMGERSVDVAVRASTDDVRLIEISDPFAPIGASGPDPGWAVHTVDAQHGAGSDWLLAQSEALRSVDQFATFGRTLATHVRALLGFERAVVYRFDEDGSGEVVAGSTIDDLPSYLGLRFPASDIPETARRLYEQSPARIIVDGGSEPVPIIGHESWTEPLDLTHSRLRGVPAVHRQYMRNMGIRASVSVAVHAGGRLWGLMSCHDRQARQVSAGQVASCVLLVRLAAERLRELDPESGVQAISRRESDLAHVAASLAPAVDPLDVAVSAECGIRQLAGAEGLIIRAGDRIVTDGVVPAPRTCASLLDHLARTVPAQVWWTEGPIVGWGPVDGDGGAIAGVACARLTSHLDDLIVWIRPETVRTVEWAGEPSKRVIWNRGRVTSLQPRASFDRWRQTVRGRSARWRTWQIETIRGVGPILSSAIERHRGVAIERHRRTRTESSLRLARSDLARQRQAVAGLLADVVDDPSRAKEALSLVRPMLHQVSRLAGIESVADDVRRGMESLEDAVTGDRPGDAGVHFGEDADSNARLTAFRSALHGVRSQLDALFVAAERAAESSGA